MNLDREPLPSRVDGLPPLSPAALAGLQSGLEALGLADLAEGSRLALVDHLRLLVAWNRSINLSAIRDPEVAVRAHILDSLSAVAVLREHGIDALLDLGSGAGYPGLPLAVVLPARRCLLVESVTKKSAFLAAAVAVVAGRTAAAERIDVFNGRAEVLAADRAHRERWPAVVARAIAPLAGLAELALPLVARGGLLVAWKRRSLEVELAIARPVVAMLGGGPPRVVDTTVDGLQDHVLVVVEKIGPTPAGYPRDPAQRLRRARAMHERLPSA